MNVSRSLKLISVNLLLLFVASCALKIPAYVEVKVEQVPTYVNSDLYMAGLYYDGNGNLPPAYWINDQKISCDFPINGSTPTYFDLPKIAIDNSGDMFMAFTYLYSDENLTAGLCINRTYQELSIPTEEEYDSISSINDILEMNGEVYVVGSVYRSQLDCTGAEQWDQSFQCAAIWRSSTHYTPEFLPVSGGALPNIKHGYPVSAYADGGHVYVLANITNYDYSQEVGYWRDNSFHKQTSVFSGIAHLHTIDMAKIKVVNGSVYVAGTYTITSNKKVNVFYLKDDVLFVVNGIDDVGTGTVTGLEIVNDTVYIVFNVNGLSKLIAGDKMTTLPAKNASYSTQAYGLAVNSSGVVYVVGTTYNYDEGSEKAAIWSNIADPKFYDNVSYFTDVAIK